MFNRSRSNLATWFTLSMGSILVIFAGVLYLREVRDRLQNFDQALYSTSRIMAAGVESYVYGGQERTDLENVPVLGSDGSPLSTDLFFARWYTSKQQLLQFVGPVPPEQLVLPTGFQTVTVTAPTTAATLQLRQLTLPVTQDGRLIGYLQIAASLDPVVQPLQQFRLSLVVGVPLALGAIALTGWLLGGKAMQPILQSYTQLQQFTADASHELRAPLAGILSHAQVGLMEPIDPEEQHTRLTVISEVAESMGLLVSQLLFLARHEGKLSPDMLKPIDLVPLLRHLLNDYTAQAHQKQHSIHGNFPDAAVWVLAEPDLLRQVFANILSNAHRYTPEGGTIEMSLEQTARWATVHIRDTGVGIEAEALAQIFDRFYRVDSVRTRTALSGANSPAGGFGLGLAIARQIVDAHSGTIAVESTVGKGSTFEVKIPILQTMR